MLRKSFLGIVNEELGENNYPFKVSQFVMGKPELLFSDDLVSNQFTQVYYNSKKEIIYLKSLKGNTTFSAKLLVPALIPDYWNQILPEYLSFHMHAFCEITQVLSGRGIYIVNNQLIEVKKNDILLFNENVPHFWFPDPEDPAHINVYHFFPKMLLKAPSDDNHYMYLYSLRSNDFQYLLFDDKSEMNWQLMSRLNRIFHEFSRADIAYQSIIIAELLEISTFILRHLSSKDFLPQKEETKKQSKNGYDAVDAAVDYINNHFTDPELNIVRIGQVVSMNSNYLSNLFKKSMGITLTGYITQLRMAKATDLLSNTSTSITDISQQCGYSNFSSFYRSFTTVLGKSPSAYRKEKN